MIPAARSAKARVDAVSGEWAASGETIAHRVVYAFPPSESRRSQVSFESR